MKIGLVIYENLDVLSGGYLYDRRLVQNLTALGDEIIVISLKWEDYPLCLAHNFSPTVRQRLLSQPVDVLLEDELTHPSLFYLNTILRREGRFPIVSIVHHLRIDEQRSKFWQPLYRMVERRYLDTLDGVICNSRATRQSVERNVGRPMPAVIAYPAADHFGQEILQNDNKSPRADGMLRILFAGNVIPRKGLGTLLEALGMVREKNLSLTVAGSTEFDPGYARRMVKTARRLLPLEKVEFTGRLTDEALADTYRRHDLLVVPSLHEGFGIVYLEAMRAGMPPVGTTGGGAGEIITSGQDGFLINPGDSAGLAQIFRQLLDEPDRLNKMKINARKRADEFPTWMEDAQRIRNFLVERTQP